MLAPAQQGGEFSALGLAQFDTIAYIHLGLLVAGGPDEQLNRVAGVSCSAKTFTPKQGQYLAFIHAGGTRACTAGLRPKPTCSNIFGSARPRFTKWW